jgi:hypothetical protein
MRLLPSLRSLCLAASLCSPVLYAQNTPVGPKGAPSSQPVDSFTALQSAKEKATSPAEKAEISFLWLLDNESHPKAPEVKAEALAIMDTLKQEGATTTEAFFLAQLLILFDTSDTPKRITAIQSLSQSQDARAIVPLIYALRDSSVEVRESVASGLGAFVDPRIEAALTYAVRTETEKVRIAAISSLAKQKTPAAGDVLLSVFLDEDAPKDVREASRVALLEYYPEKISKDEVALDRRGRWLLVPASAGFGGYALATVGVLGQNEVGAVIGGFGGTLLGASAAYFLTQKENMPLAQASYLTTGGAWGLGVGLALGGALNESTNANSAELVTGLGLVGELGGLALTIATRNNPNITRRTSTDHFEANTIGLMGLLAARGINVLRDDFFITTIDPEFGFEVNTPQFADELVISSALSVSSLLAGELLSPKLSFSRSDVGLMALCGYEGGFYGGLSPFLSTNDSFDDPNAFDEETVARSLVSIGIAGGVLGCGALSQKVELPKQDLGEMFVADSFGKILGVGIPLLAKADGEEPYIGGTLLGGAVGLAASTLLRDEITLTPGDSVLTGFATMLGAWQGFALAEGLTSEGDVDDDLVIGGATLVGLSLGGLGSMALTQKLDLSPWEAVWLSSGAFWGAWFSTFYTLIDDQNDANVDDDFLFILGATDLGLGATIAMLSPKLNVHPTRIGIATLGGATGATVASLGMALFSLNGDNIIKANLVGSAVGLLGGGIAAARYDVNSRTKKKNNKVAMPALKAPHLTLSPLTPLNPKSAPPMAFMLSW